MRRHPAMYRLRITRGIVVAVVLGVGVVGCALPPTAGVPPRRTASTDPGQSTAVSPTPSRMPVTPDLMDNGQPVHVPVPGQLRAPIAGTIDRAALHQQASRVLETDPNATTEYTLSTFNEWITIRTRLFPELGDTQVYDFIFNTLENDDGTLTDARCTVPMPGWMPTTTPDDWPALLDLCINLPYRDANPSVVSAWAKDAVKQLQATTPGPTPVFQLVDLNCLHWQVGWEQDIDPGGGYQGLISLDASTGFSPLTPTRGDDGTQPDHPTAYGCPG